MEDHPNRKNDKTNSNSQSGCEEDYKSHNKAPSLAAKKDDADTLDFVVTEKNEEDREFVGGQKKFPGDNELDIQENSDLMEQEALSEDNYPEQLSTSKADKADFQPIGDSSPPPPPEPANPDDTLGHLPLETTTTDQQQVIKKLSPEEIKSIEKDLYNNNSYLTDREKEELISKMSKLNDSEGDKPPAKSVTPPSTDTFPETKPHLPSPKMALRGKGIAYFYKSFIQIVGNQELQAEDELCINNRCYELQPKKFNTKLIAGVGVTLFALLLFFIGSQFISDSGTGKGEIIGMALDETGQPYVQQATIRFPDLGISIKSTPQGFFRSGYVPEGTHKIEYFAGDKLLKIDYATVVSDKITMLSLRPSEIKLAKAETRETQSSSEPPAEKLDSRAEPTSTKEAISKSAVQKTTRKKSKSSGKKSTKDRLAKITLAANVSGAKLVIDENVLGAGNLTYSKIKPGKRKYTVSKDGFQSASGIIELSAGENKTLNVNLAPMAQDAKAEVFSEEDFYRSGLAALKEGSYETAIEDLTEAINKQPSDALAYLARADAYTITRQKELAYNDYVRAAEIFQIKKDLNQAVTAYNNAIKLNNKSVTAYLGRANTYLSKSEEIAAIADYQTAIKLDKRNAQAYFGLGEARFRQGRYKKASKHFRDARSIDSKNPLTHQYLMLCYLAMDDINKVKKSYEKFKNLASEEQMNRFREDKKFSAILRIIEND